MHVVYGLQDPRDNQVFYVGLTSDISDRYIQHIKCEGNNAEKNKRVQELKALGLLPIPLTLETVHTRAYGQERELYWIGHYRHLGMPLCNVKREAPPVRFNAVPKPLTEDDIDTALKAWQAGATGPREMERALNTTYYRARLLCQELKQQGLTGVK